MVFEPTPEGRARGRQILDDVASLWVRPGHFFHFRAGGHVAALRHHQGSDLFAKADISRFFTNTSRSKVVRSLKHIGFSFDDAWAAATESTVRHPDANFSYVIPYGFVQSPMLASLCLATSRLGKQIERAIGSGIRVTVYVDDIVLSGSTNQRALIEHHLDAIIDRGDLSGYPINGAKLERPAASVDVFNIDLRKSSLRVLEERIRDFEDVVSARPAKQVADGIIGYVRTVNEVQAQGLGDLWDA